MPKINRIRIVNFFYNNDNREIQDETFRLYDGENALFNLANGGGKSVLIQLIMQPIVPDLKIQKRRMVSYFKRNTMPAFVMLEWLLDNPVKKDYLMTGISIAPKNSGTDESNKINYYTFMSHYDRATEFDLSSLPFVNREEGNLKILPFERSREAVRRQVSNMREAFYFSRDDAPEYRRQLLQFGVSQEEWKSIIAKMNNDEGGIDELFERCSTSDSVFNEWILKTVEKAVLSGHENDIQIQELLDGLVADTLKKESYIQDEQVMKAYFQVHEGMEEELNQLYYSLEVHENVKQKLGSMYGSLSRKQSNDKLELEELSVREQEYYEAQNLIVQEEASERFYEAQEDLESANEVFDQKERELGECKFNRQEVKQNIRVQTAAKYNGEIQRAEAAAAAIRIRLEQMQKEDQTFNRLRNLRFSLKLRYEQQKRELEQERLTAEEQKEHDSKELRRREAEVQQLEDIILEETGKLGELNQKVKTFEAYEESFINKTGIRLSRNVLRQLDPAETEHQKWLLEKTVSDYRAQSKTFAVRATEIDVEQEQLQKEMMRTATETVAVKNDITVQEQKLEEFTKQERNCSRILEKYELEQELLYEKTELSHKLNEKSEALKERRRLCSLEESQMREMIRGVRENHVYIPALLLEELDKHDIEYASGEFYLGNLAEAKRQKLLEKNPLIPFALIIKSQDLKKIEQVQIRQLFIRQMIPVFTYEQLNQSFAEEHQLFRISSGLHLIGRYETRIFADMGKIAYLEQMEKQSTELQKMLRHLEQEIKSIHQDGNVLDSFTYGKDDYRQMSERLTVLQDKLNEYCRLKTRQEQEKAELAAEKIQVQDELERVRALCQKEEEKLTAYAEFLQKDAGYQEDIQNADNLEVEQQKNKEMKEEVSQRLKQLRQEQQKLETDLVKLRGKINQSQKFVLQFEDAEKGEVLEEATEFLQSQYEELRGQLQSSVQELNRRLDDEIKRLAEQREELEALHMEPKLYESITYSKDEFRRLSAAEQEVEAALEHLQVSWNKSQKSQVRCKALFDTAEKELKKAGLEDPLDKQNIRQNYENRRKQISYDLECLREQRDQIKKRINQCDKVAGWIKIVLPGDIIRYQKFKLAGDIELQYNELLGEFKTTAHEYAQRMARFHKHYLKIRSEYFDKHSCIADILDSVQEMKFDQKEQSSEELYFHIEEFIKKKENLQKLLDFYVIQLENINHTKKQIVDQCVSYAVLIYEDVCLIANRSRIRLSGKSRAVQMLKIDIPKELDNQIHLRMEQHIENVLRHMVELTSSDLDRNSLKYKDRLRGLISTRELLNQLIGTSKIQIHVYKIDLNESNSGLKKWEDAIAENSGGEKFVVFFTMVSVLISYTREAAGRSLGMDAMKESKVLLMDNPFGATSSEHLLKAVIDIAKTFNIQLICLSDLSQSSITNRFSLIYQFTVRKKMYNEKEMLKIGPAQFNKDGIKENERLEHAAVYERYVQGSLFD